MMGMENMDFKAMHNDYYRVFAHLERDINKYAREFTFTPEDLEAELLRSPLAKMPQLEDTYKRLAGM